jgi:hypothetical protein
MTFIDWSDSEGMFDLLLEFIRDEKNASVGDVPRQRFLSRLLIETMAAQEMTPKEAIQRLKAIQDLVDEEFKNDPVLLHVMHLVEELERIQ